VAATSPDTIVVWTSFEIIGSGSFQSSSDETPRMMVNTDGLMTTIIPRAELTETFRFRLTVIEEVHL
jgi:hypothetical protein